MFDLMKILEAGGYLGLFGIIFAETGLLIGFFLPGDSLLFTAGILAAQGFFNIYILIAVMLASAIIGDSVGYNIGKKLGPKIFNREESILFHKDHIEKAQQFYAKHGPKTIILARFIPIIRTFAPTLAGVGKMEYRTFLTYNIVGALLWVFSITLLGYFLGLTIPNIEHYIIPGVIVIVLLSVSPYIRKIVVDKNFRDSIIIGIKQLISKKSIK